MKKRKTKKESLNWFEFIGVLTFIAVTTIAGVWGLTKLVGQLRPASNTDATPSYVTLNAAEYDYFSQICKHMGYDTFYQANLVSTLVVCGYYASEHDNLK